MQKGQKIPAGGSVHGAGSNCPSNSINYGTNESGMPPNIDTHMFERTKQMMMEVGGGPPSTSKLEKNKQYLEQLR